MERKNTTLVSVDDNIDLFGKVKKDETEPQF